MDEKEIRTKGIEYAFRYAEYENKVNPNKPTYFTKEQIIGLASRIEKFIRNGE